MRTTIRDERILACDDVWELEMSIYSIESVAKEEFEKLENILGTRWTKDMVTAKSGAGTPDELHYSIGMLLQPNLLKIVTDAFNGTKKQVNQEAEGSESLFSIDRERFKQIMGGQVGGEVRSTGRKRSEGEAGFKEGATRKIGGGR
jgi:hypothetical protein